MKKQYYISSFSFISVLFPTIALAQGPNLDYISGAVTQIGILVAQLIPIVIAIALLVFIWGLVKFIMASGNEDAKEVGKRQMIWGIITLFVIIAVWGIVGLLGEITGVEMGAEITPPSVDFVN